MRRILVLGILMLSALVRAETDTTMESGYIELGVTPFSNMASGYQATNPGFRLILKSPSGAFVAGGALTMDAVMRGRSDDASQGSAYGKLILHMDEAMFPMMEKPRGRTAFHGSMSICMAENPDATIDQTVCKSLSGNIHADRPFQWIDKQVDYVMDADGNITITKYYGSTGEGGTSSQLSLALFHPAFGFAAPGKAFKDYQSPLVLDLDHNGKLDLVNVWNDKTPISFDLNGNGQKIRTGWVKPNDGLLFWDNGSGCVKNGTQFFGEYTDSKDGKRTYENGFAALASILDPKGTGHVVAANHPQLKLWRNTAQDGVCKKSEVFPARKYVKEILLSYETQENVKLTEDNEIRLTGNYVGVDGKKHLIGDVWFKQRRNPLANNN